MSDEIKTVTPEAVKVDDCKTGSTNGKDWTLWPIGIKIKETWYNGAVFKSEDLERFKIGQEITLEFYKDEKYGWKFRLPKENDLIRSEINDLKKRLEQLELKQQIP